jgi:PAP2 superfamily
MRFERGELYLLTLIAAAALVSVALALAKGVTVDTGAIAIPVAANFFFIAVGQFYRLRRPDPGIAAVATSIGLVMLFGHVFRLLNYLLLPYHVHGTDAFLAQVDAAFGFVWADFVLALARYPDFCDFLRQVYQSCGWQIAAIIIVLGKSKHTEEIVRFSLALAIGAIVTIEVWALFPSSTPAAFQVLPADVAARLGLVVSPEHGAWLVRTSYEGLAHLAPDDLKGIVGFPSYHTVLALLSVWHARKVRVLVLPIIALNLFMLPAILLHGAHNLIDVFGGAAVTIVSVWMTNLICAPRAERQPKAVAA